MEPLVTGPGRLHALLDGVFAIAMTLLVLNLPQPADSKHLVHDLLHEWPSYVAYLVSVLSVGMLWIEHHGMMSAVREVNRRFRERTLLFLLFISIVAWPTSIAAHYASHGFQAEGAVVLYATTMLCMGLSFNLSWRYLAEHPSMVAEPARTSFGAGSRRALYGGLVYLLAIAVAFMSPGASFASDALIAVYFAASKSEVQGLIHRAAHAGGQAASG